MQERIPQSVAKLIVFKAFLAADHVTAATGLTIAMQVSQNGGAFANFDGGALNATEISAGWYKAQLQTADTDTLGPLVVRGTEGTIDPVELITEVVKATNAGFTGVPDAVPGAASGLSIVGSLMGLTDGAITAAKIAAGAKIDLVDKTGFSLSEAGVTAISESVLSLSVADVEDAASQYSLCALVLGALESSIVNGTWTIRKTDGTTFVAKTVTSDANAAPITGVT